MKEIILTRGCVAIVDDEDYESLNQHKWCVDGPAKYAIRRIGVRPGVVLFMHKVILGTSEVVDHINRITLDNRKENLRIADKAKNSMNRGVQCNSSTGYKGVSESKGKYQAYIKLDGNKISLGTFDTAIEAAIAYNQAALNLFGEFANINSL